MPFVVRGSVFCVSFRSEASNMQSSPTAMPICPHPPPSCLDHVGRVGIFVATCLHLLASARDWYVRPRSARPGTPPDMGQHQTAHHTHPSSMCYSCTQARSETKVVCLGQSPFVQLFSVFSIKRSSDPKLSRWYALLPHTCLVSPRSVNPQHPQHPKPAVAPLVHFPSSTRVHRPRDG